MSMRHYSVNDGGLLIYDSELEVLGLVEDDLTSYSEVDGEFYPFTEGRESISLNEDSFYILPLQNAPSLFFQAYADYEEAKAEIIEALGEQKNLPFDIDDRLGEFSGVTFG